jgi:NAD(P)-dependent dehydrogenase (short-subunit alcohol dehydrogenase family)
MQRRDVTKIPEINSMVEESVKTFGRIDRLVNNAGGNIPQLAVDETEEAWDRVIGRILTASSSVPKQWER